MHAIHVDFCNINTISLYSSYDINFLGHKQSISCNTVICDGIYFTRDNIVFIVDS